MSLAESNRKELESSGEYVIRANKSWFAVFPDKLKKKLSLAAELKRKSINFVVYRTVSENERDHYVIPYEYVQNLYRDDFLTHSEVNGTIRWNCTIKEGKLHVSHSAVSVDVSEYCEAPLLFEDSESLRPFPEELDENEVYREGSVSRITVNRYERDPKARAKCLQEHGSSCAICGFNFEREYGKRMSGFIHVHHINPISLKASEYDIDPVNDLMPVCPNCHAVIHSKNEILSVVDVQNLMKESQQK